MFAKRNFKIIVFASCLLLGLIPTVSVHAAFYNFKMDQFELMGNGLGIVSDDFDDGSINPNL